MKTLYVSYYVSNDLARQTELDHCFLENEKSMVFDRIIVLVDPGVIFPFVHIGNTPVSIIRLGEKATYLDFFKTVNNTSTNEDINVISNSDIIFDDSLELASKMDRAQCYALSRWELAEDKKPNPVQVQVFGDSQDCWIFKGTIAIPKYCEFPMGKMGCDNRISHELQEIGYSVSNPSLVIKTWHLHNIEYRAYTNQERNKETVVPPPYLTLPLTDKL